MMRSGYVLRGVTLLGSLLLLALSVRADPPETMTAARHHETFDRGDSEWFPLDFPAGCRVGLQRRQTEIYREGTGSEQIQIQTPSSPGRLQLEFAIPPSRGVEDLTARMWVRSNRPGVSIGLRVVFPKQTDPQTGEALFTIIEDPAEAGALNQEGSWQQLICQISAKKLSSQLRLLRQRFREELADINKVGWYVDRVILSFDRLQGSTECFVDDLVVTPYIKVEENQIATISDKRRDSLANVAIKTPQAEVRLDRLMLHHEDGTRSQPMFPRIVPHQGESPEFLSDLGFNPVWVRDATDRELIRKLAEQGIWTMATPPRIASGDQGQTASTLVGLLPFESSLDPVLFWMLGNGIAADERKNLVNWVNQITAADQQRNRPIIADVTGQELIYSRYIPLLGMSRPILNSSLGYREYREWLLARQKLARPGSFTWTWVQTDAVSNIVKSREGLLQTPVTVHYEQMRLQLYAALAAGCRGVGYWTTQGLDQDAPGGLERRLSIKQLNLELLLLEELLADAELQGQTPLQTRHHDSTQDRIEAAIFKTSSGMLFLPVWYDRYGQFVPGQMVDEKVELLIKGGIPEAGKVWEISTTGVRNLNRKQVAGGTLVTLGRLNTTAAIFVPQDDRMLDRVRRMIERISATSAATLLELARVKLDVTRAVDRELASLGAEQEIAPHKLKEAQEWVLEAGAELQRRNYHSARLKSEYACQALRILQRAHWDQAARSLAQPVCSPHLVGFESLPDHWRLMARVGRSSANTARNQLLSGNFEDSDRFRREWKTILTTCPAIQATADLQLSATQGESSALRLAAGAENIRDVPRFLTEPPVVTESPEIAVRRGDLIHVSGKIKVITAPVRTTDGVTIADTVGGDSLALAFRDATDWQEFEFLRTPGTVGPFQLKITLHGLGEARLDNLTVKVISTEISPEPILQTGGSRQSSPDSEVPYWKKITRLKGIPNLPSLSEFDFLNEPAPIKEPPSQRQGTADRPMSGQRQGHAQ